MPSLHPGPPDRDVALPALAGALVLDGQVALHEGVAHAPASGEQRPRGEAREEAPRSRRACALRAGAVLLLRLAVRRHLPLRGAAWWQGVVVAVCSGCDGGGWLVGSSGGGSCCCLGRILQRVVRRYATGVILGGSWGRRGRRPAREKSVAEVKMCYAETACLLGCICVSFILFFQRWTAPHPLGSHRLFFIQCRQLSFACFPDTDPRSACPVPTSSSLDHLFVSWGLHFHPRNHLVATA